jgi:broad specificity phosphatase PhoE
MALIIVRHGRTEANASGLLLGRLDPPLDDEGLRQARALGDALGPVERIICSPLGRTRQTAALVGGDELTVTVDDRWIELDYGDLDGMPVRDVPAETWTQWRSNPDFAPPGGESLRDLGRRVGEACADLADEAARADVVVVTHVSPIKAAVAWALDAGDELAWRLHVTPASITRIGFSGFGPVVQSFNEVAHLGGEPRAG